MDRITREKQNAVLNKNMNRKDLTLENKKAEPIKNNIIKQLEIINKSFSELESVLNRLAMKKFISDDKNALAIQCSKKCASQAQAARSLITNFENKYCDDQKMILIQELDERISFLEEKLSKM